MRLFLLDVNDNDEFDNIERDLIALNAILVGGESIEDAEVWLEPVPRALAGGGCTHQLSMSLALACSFWQSASNAALIQ